MLDGEGNSVRSFNTIHTVIKVFEKLRFQDQFLGHGSHISSRWCYKSFRHTDACNSSQTLVQKPLNENKSICLCVCVPNRAYMLHRNVDFSLLLTTKFTCCQLDFTPSNVGGINQRFGGTYCLQFQGTVFLWNIG